MPERGDIVLAHAALDEMDRYIVKRVIAVAGENITIASLRNTIGKEDIRNAIKAVGLDPDDPKFVGKYSMGMKQRLGLAQAIMEKPKILILDEPMNGLDNAGVMEIRKILLTLKQNGTTIIIVSHNTEDINMLCDTVHEMDKGVLI